MGNNKKIKRLDWLLGSKLFYCRYILKDNPIFVDKMNSLIHKVFAVNEIDIKYAWPYDNIL